MRLSPSRSLALPLSATEPISARSATLRAARVLFDQQHGNAVVAQAGHHLQHLLDDQRSQSQRGFIEHQQTWLGHQCAPMAASGARHRRAWMPSAPPLLQAREDGKHLFHACVLVTLPLAPQRKPPSSKLSRQTSRQTARASGTRPSPRATMPSTEGLAIRSPSSRISPRQQTHGRRQQRGLACTVGADHRDDLTGLDVQLNLMHGLHRAVKTLSPRSSSNVSPLMLRPPHRHHQIGVEHALIGLNLAGVPSAITVPNSSTVMRSARFITNSISCSTTRMPGLRHATDAADWPAPVFQGAADQQQARPTAGAAG